MTLVCRRWHRLFYKERDLWRTLTLPVLPGQEQKWEGGVGRRLLRRVGGLVEALTLLPNWRDPAVWPGVPFDLGSLLSQLQPCSLKALECKDGSQPRNLAAVQLFSQLQSLQLNILHGMEGAAMAAIAQLQRLTRLDVHNRSELNEAGLPAAELQQLVRLPRLQRLKLQDIRIGLEGSLPLPPPATSLPSRHGAGAIVPRTHVACARRAARRRLL